MKPTVFIPFTGIRNSYTNMSLTKLGHTNYNIDTIHTIKDIPTNKSYVVVEFFKEPTAEEVATLNKNIDKFLNVDSEEVDTFALRVLFVRAKGLEEGTKRKFWFEHATYVSPKDGTSE